MPPSCAGRSSLSGFTLIEAVIVMALLITCASLAGALLVPSRSAGEPDPGERALAVLWQARSRAAASLCASESCVRGTAHGVYFGSPGVYVLYAGNDYASRETNGDEVIDAAAGVAAAGCTEVTFAANAATAVCREGNAVELRRERGRSVRIHVEPSGRIWEER